jgi:hypothetical protein
VESQTIRLLVVPSWSAAIYTFKHSSALTLRRRRILSTMGHLLYAFLGLYDHMLLPQPSCAKEAPSLSKVKAD